MKRMLWSFMVLITFSCYAQKKQATAVLDQNENLVGIATKNSFLVPPFNDWFIYNYDNYTVDEAIIKQLKPLLNNITIKGFMGTWCGDSQEQIPIFYKVLDSTKFDYKNLELVTVNEAKKTPDNLQKGYNIERVPTFIFYKKGIEIGRFVEYPRESVEADMLKIVSGAPYKHSYE